MMLSAGAMDIADCCGGQMLVQMWFQVSIWETGLCGESDGACDEMLASLDAELNACLCDHRLDG
jgi:hypothetical protein